MYTQAPAKNMDFTTALRPLQEKKLSVDAKEFVPRGHQQSTSRDIAQRYPSTSFGQGKKSVQSRLNVNQEMNNVNVAQDQMLHFHPFEDQLKHEQTSPAIFEPTDEENYALDFIRDIVNQLSDDPGIFDSISVKTLEIFKKFKTNYFVISNAMEIIFNKSTEEPNFRYMGAKLYGLLESIDKNENDSIFNELLKLKLAYHQTEIAELIRKTSNNVQGTILFLAELYMEFQNTTTLREIAHNIILLIFKLISVPTTENIKSVCLSLKLAGYNLEIDFPVHMKEILNNLRSLKDAELSVKRNIEAIVVLQQNNWGRKEMPTTMTANNIDQFNMKASAAPAPIYSNEPVFYGPDGQILTEEESHFLQSNANTDGGEEYDDEYDDADEADENEMDAEMQKAYEDFLNASNNK